MALGFYQDITNRKRAELALNRRVEELSILHQTAQTVANVTDLSTTLDQVAEMVATVRNAVQELLDAGLADRPRLQSLSSLAGSP